MKDCRMIQKMPKKKFFSAIFSRSNKQEKLPDKQNDPNLVTDAVPVPPDSEDQGEINNSTSIPSSVLAIAENDSRELVSTPMANGAPFPNSMNPLALPPNNNMLAIHNTQAQNVFQFSNINNLHIGSVYKIGAPSPETEPGVSTSPKGDRTKSYTRTIQSMMQSTEPLNPKYLSEISKHMGEGWQDVMRQLKFSDAQIHQATVDFSIDGGLREVIYQLLLDWTRNDENATLGEITSLLWKSGHHETVYYLKHRYKAEKKGTSGKSESDETA